MKTYISEVEGLLMYNPAVFLHKGQKLKATQDTVEILQALTTGKLALVELCEVSKVEVETSKEPQLEEEKPETNQAMNDISEQVKPTRRGVRK